MTLSRDLGVKKPQEAQKAKAVWAMKAAKDRKEEFCDPAREEDISRTNKNAIGDVGGTSQGSNCCVGQGIEARCKSVSELARCLVEARQR